MGNAASGEITHRYHVVYTSLSHPEVGHRATTVALTSGYTTFEHIRQIIRTKIGGALDDVEILAVVRVTGNGNTVAARAAYIEALRAAAEGELADLVDALNARVWTGADAGDDAVTARHVVDVHGITFDVCRTEQGTVVYVNTDDAAAGPGGVHIHVNGAVYGEYMHIEG